MLVIKHDHVIEDLAPCAADKSFSELEKLAANALGAPETIAFSHVANQICMRS
jgi:hypothetical protein